MAKEKLISYLAGINHIVGKEMAGSSHTLTCCVSKFRSSLGAGKKQPRVWLQYVSGVEEMLLYPSFGVPLVLLVSTSDDSEMARNGFEDISKWCATSNICSSVSKTEFFGTGSYVSWKMILCP